ncbi:hypothetical protein CEXT_651571 [Caerostris extrusa]|uniref:Uncharacterized protein n=1 Tax=Caerostris extrusa TaxID=172846 RepID=A0AAV4XWH6_CAEEX|nr:hypothetical protein CEXT_651571 [Caerostris extrusa]
MSKKEKKNNYGNGHEEVATKDCNPSLYARSSREAMHGKTSIITFPMEMRHRYQTKLLSLATKCSGGFPAGFSRQY